MPLLSAQSRSHALRSFTLIEAIATMVIISIIGTLSSTMIWSAAKTNNDAITRAELSSQASLAMERITTELRTIQTLLASSPTSADITTLTPTTLTFNAGSSSRTISFSSGQILLSGSYATSIALASNISTFTLQGYDVNNTAVASNPSAAQIATIRRLEITITASLNGVNETLRTRVFLRALASGSGAS